MGIKGDVLDLTDLQRRGILKKEQETQQPPLKVDGGGYFDFSGSKKSESSVQPDLPNPLGFLDSLANASSASDTPSFMPSYSANTSSSDSLELQGLKSKIDDLEYKLDRLMEKIAKLEGS